MKRPDFLVVGSGKAGTTFVDSYLRQHSEVALPGGIKETHFFHQGRIRNESYTNRNLYKTTTLEEYNGLFCKEGSHIKKGEVCPSYLFFNQETIDSLKEYYDDYQKIKIIIFLREPVSKILSHYHFIINSLQHPYDTLESLVRKEKADALIRTVHLPDLFLLAGTQYSQLIKPYLDNFHKVKIMFYKDLKNNEVQFLKELCDFLNIAYQPMIAERLTRNESNKRIPRNNLFQFLLSLGRMLPMSLRKKLPLSKLNRFYTKPSRIEERTLNELKQFSKREKIELEKLLNIKITQWE